MTSSGDTGPIEKVSARALAVWGVALAAYVFAVFARTSLSATGVEAAIRFHASSAALSLFTVLQLGVYAAMQIPAGAAVDRIGPRRAIAIGSVLIGLGQLGIAFATGIPTAIGARVLVGSGDAFIFLSVVRLLPAWFPPRHVGLVTQLTGMVGQLGQLLSLVPLVGLLHARGWTTAFVLAGSLTLLVGALVLIAVRDGHPAHVLTTVDEDDAAPPRPAPASPGLETGDGLLLRTWRNPGTRAGFWIHFTTPFSANAFALLWGFAYMTKAEHMSDSVALGVLTVYVAGCLVSSPVLGVLAGRFAHQRAALAAALVVAQVVAWAVVLSWPGDAPAPLLYVLVLTLSTGGPGSLIGFDFSRSTNPLSTLGLATGMVNAAGFISSLATVLAIGIILDLQGQGTPDLFTDHGFAIAWLVQVPVWLLGLGMLRRSLPAYHRFLADQERATG